MTMHYTATAKLLHWLMAALLFGLLALGFYMHDLPLYISADSILNAVHRSYDDIVVLKNGDILEGVHTKVTPTTLEVTESNGKKTIYKKSQVLSVKRK